MGTFEDCGFFLKAGEAPYTVVNGLCSPTSTSWCRWGDYLAASFDGLGSDKVWIAGEYATSTGDWGTWIGQD